MASHTPFQFLFPSSPPETNRSALAPSGLMTKRYPFLLSLKGEIITTPFSYVATTSSIMWEECKPVFVEFEVAVVSTGPAGAPSNNGYSAASPPARFSLLLHPFRTVRNIALKQGWPFRVRPRIQPAPKHGLSDSLAVWLPA